MSIECINESNANDVQEGAYGGFDVVESKATSRLNKICGRRKIQQHWALETRM